MIGFIRKFIYEYKEYLVLVILLIISLLLIPLNNNSQTQKVKAYAFGTFALLTNGIDGIAGLFRSDSEIIRLKKENSELMLENNLLREYALENSELKNLMDFKDTVSTHLVSASVISKVISSIDGNYILNVGISDSVLVGMPVINEKGFVGVVHNIESDFSLVRTYSNTRLKLAVRDQRSRYESIISWDGSNLVLRNIPITADISVGDRFVTSEFSTLVPPAIPVGIVSNLGAQVSGVYSKIYLTPFTDLNSIKNVFVLSTIRSKQIDNLEMNLLKTGNQ